MWSMWRSHFESNARRPLPGPPDVAGVPAAWRAPLCDSLARFQIGEGGEGRIAKEIDRVMLAGVDADYRAALKLFVREEGRHARILAAMVRALGGSLLRETWSERLFVRGRRLLGVRLKLLVLLVAEVIGLGFYGQIADRLGDGELARQLREISGDEARHLEFHVDFFRSQVDGAAGRAAFRAVWWTVAGLACAVVLFDHRRTLRALGAPRREALRRLLALVARVEREVAAPVAGRGALAGADLRRV